MLLRRGLGQNWAIYLISILTNRYYPSDFPLTVFDSSEHKKKLDFVQTIRNPFAKGTYSLAPLCIGPKQ
jgi:hypothetical protein